MRPLIIPALADRVAVVVKVVDRTGASPCGYSHVTVDPDLPKLLGRSFRGGQEVSDQPEGVPCLDARNDDSVPVEGQFGLRDEDVLEYGHIVEGLFDVHDSSSSCRCGDSTVGTAAAGVADRDASGKGGTS